MNYIFHLDYYPWEAVFDVWLYIPIKNISILLIIFRTLDVHHSKTIYPIVMKFTGYIELYMEIMYTKRNM